MCTATSCNATSLVSFKLSGINSAGCHSQLLQCLLPLPSEVCKAKKFHEVTKVMFYVSCVEGELTRPFPGLHELASFSVGAP